MNLSTKSVISFTTSFQCNSLCSSPSHGVIEVQRIIDVGMKKGNIRRRIGWLAGNSSRAVDDKRHPSAEIIIFIKMNCCGNINRRFAAQFLHRATGEPDPRIQEQLSRLVGGCSLFVLFHYYRHSASSRKPLAMKQTA